MKKYILSLCAALLLPLPVPAGEVAPGSVPGTLNYQGRLERDNAPVTGRVHIIFRVYNSPTAVNASGGECGGVSQPCLWESPEITAQATQGIFSADLTPPAAVLSGGERLYLEVQVESDTLSPREPLNSVAYAVVAKRLEDGADVRFSSFTATYAALISTAPGAYMTVGTDTPYPTSRLTVAGDITLSEGGRIRFPNGSLLLDGFTGTNSGAVVSASNVTIEGGTGILFGIPTVAAGEKARITAAGDLGVGTNAPMGKLDVDGTLYVGSEGIYDRDDTEVNIKEDLVVDGGQLRGIGNNYITLGETANTIIAATNNTPRLWLNASGFLGVGTNAPAVRIHSASDIAADDGVRGGQVSIGDYSSWTTLDNEIRSEAGSHLLLQQTNPFNVGIGTDTPREKLHVRGSVLSDYGVIAATAAFSGNVRVDGDLDANSSNGNMVYLSSTIVYGSLQVTGGIGSMAGIPAYIASSNTFTGQNTFSNQLTVSSDVIVNSRLGVGAIGFDFPGDDYLQVGGNTSEFAHNAAAYLVAGSTGEARVAFYRGPVKAASLETLSGNYLPNLALVVGGQAKTVTDSVYHRIQNSVVWISTGYNTTPAIFVSSTIGNVGVGISVLDPNWKLTVDGNIRISRTGGGLLFPDGTSITTGNLGALSVGNVSNNSDAVIQSNADLSGGGNVILRAGSLDGLVLNTGGNVGIGTINPVSRLNVRGGDLVLGNPLNPYSADSVEDLVVAGNIAFDGELLQRSNSQVRLSGLMVASDVYLSTGASARTGVGTIAPQTKLEVNGDAQFGSGLTKSTFTSAGALQLATDLAVQYGGTGAGSFLLNGVLYGNGTSALQDTAAGTQYQVLRAGAGGVPAFGSINLDQAAAITGTLPVGNGGTGAATLTGVLRGNGTGAFTVMTGTAARVTRWADSNTINASAILTDNGTRFGVAAPIDAAGAITTASSGTFMAEGGAQYSLLTSSGIKVNSGSVDVTGYVNVSGRVTTSNIRMTSGAQNNYVLTSDGNGFASWENPALGAGDGWVGNEVTGPENLTLTLSGNGLYLGTPLKLALNLGNANTWTAAQAFSAGLSGSLTGNASSASALAANPADCTLPQVALGIDANGTAVCSQPSTISGNAATATALAANGGNCTLPDVALGVNALGVAECGQPTSVTGTASNVTGIVAIANGGTGQSTAANARAALDVPTRTGGDASGTWGINITGNAGGTAANVTGTVAIANGGTGATDAVSARSSLGLGSGLSITVSVRDNTGTANCNLVFTNGILTSETCP